MNLVFCCCGDNDLHQTLAGTGRVLPRYDTPEEAIAHAPTGAGVLVLADDYPTPTAQLDAALLQHAKAKHLRLYVEYPAMLAGVTCGAPRATRWERLIVIGDWFAPELPRESILAMHGAWFLPVAAAAPLLALGRVAGYRHAAYGVPAEIHPILFPLDDGVLVATSKLSHFRTARYGPTTAWRALWWRLLRWLARDDAVPPLVWQPTVSTQAGPDVPVPASAAADTFRRSVSWFRREIVCSEDHKKLALEGFESSIDHRGRQLRRAVLRGDCLGETALVFALDWALHGQPDSHRLAAAMLDTVWSAPDFRQDNPALATYGLNNWYQRAPIFYGDDNARVILPALAAARLLEDERWDEHILRCLLANLRTTGIYGFRRNRIDGPALLEHGWRHFYDEPTVSVAPHYQAYLWAAFVWAYALTGYAGFLTRTENAIRMTMARYPRWTWTNGLTQEMARMLLPLAFLVRVKATPERLEWLDRLAADLLAQMQPSGAIHELLGPLADGRYPPPSSNEAYGTNEASLIQQNGDPACDLLYTANFAFLGLHEAAAATQSPALGRAADRLAELFWRIQVRSTAHPELDGAWMRSFDDHLWEYWGSSADQGWGAWCIESGWTNAWIAAVMGLRLRGETLFDLTLGERLAAKLPPLLAEMGLPT